MSNKKSFSIGEVMLSVFILGTVLVTVSQLFSASYRSFAFSRDVIIASMLAQEGVELVKNIRDNNWANGRDGFYEIGKSSLVGIPGGAITRTKCRIDVENIDCSTSNFNACFGPSEDYCFLYYHSSTGLYTYNSAGGDEGKFKRGVYITPIGTSYILVMSTVVWNDEVLTSNAGTCASRKECVFAFTRLYKDWGQ